MKPSRNKIGLRTQRLRPLLLTLALGLGVFQAPPLLAENYSEFVSGDLSDDPAQPTLIAVDLGDNRIGGQTTDLPLDADFFTLTVPEGLEITAVILTEFRLLDSPRDGGSLVALEAGGQISNLNSSASLRGFVIAGVDSGTTVGEDLLDDLGGGTLSEGAWTFWVQNTGSITEYELTAVAEPVPLPPVPPPPAPAVPVPGLGPLGVLLLALSCLLLGLSRAGRR